MWSSTVLFCPSIDNLYINSLLVCVTVLECVEFDRPFELHESVVYCTALYCTVLARQSHYPKFVAMWLINCLDGSFSICHDVQVVNYYVPFLPNWWVAVSHAIWCSCCVNEYLSWSSNQSSISQPFSRSHHSIIQPILPIILYRNDNLPTPTLPYPTNTNITLSIPNLCNFWIIAVIVA